MVKITAISTQQMHTELMDRAARLERFAEQDPNNETLLYDLANTYHRAGLHEPALAALERWKGVASPVLDDLRGQILLALGRWNDAEALFQAALVNAPEATALLFNLGYAVWASGEDPERAAALFRRVTQHDESNANFHHHHAMALEACGDAKGAAAALARVLECEPDHLRGLAMLGRLMLDEGDFEAAAQCASSCMAAHPTDATGWQLKGQVALFQMDVESAVKSLRQALSLDTTDVDTYVTLAQASLMQGRVRHARELLGKAAAIDSQNDVALCMLGWAGLTDNDASAAQAAFDAALSVAPDNVDALSGAACIQLADGQIPAAHDLAQRALLLDPEHVVARLVAAQVLNGGSHAQDAKAIFAAVLSSSPFGPLGVPVGQAMQSTVVANAAKRLQRRMRVPARHQNH